MLFNDATDDPIIPDAQQGFGAGMISAQPPDEIPRNAAAYLLNIDLAEERAETRRGARAAYDAPGSGVVMGLAWYETPADTQLVMAQGGTLYYHDGSGWTAIPGWTGGTDRRVEMVQLVDVLYIADGSNNLHSWDGSTLTDLGTGGAAQPRQGAIIITATDRLFMAGIASEPDGLDVSDILDGATWNSSAQRIRIGAGEGEAITGLVRWDKFTVLVFKQRSIWAVNADPVLPCSAWTIERVSGSIGCVSHRTIVSTAQDVLFLSSTGVRSIRRVLSGESTATSQAISAPIQDWIDRINWQRAAYCSAVFFRDRFILSVPLDTEQENSTCFVLDSQRGAWCGIWTGWDAQAFAILTEQEQARLVWGRADGAVWKWLEYTSPTLATSIDYQDDGQPFDVEIVSRGLIFSDVESPKQLFRIEAQFWQSRANASVSAILDRGAAVPLDTSVQTALSTLTLPFTLPATLPRSGVKRWGKGGQHLATSNVVQIGVEASTEKLSVRAILASAFVNTVEIEP
jgi:hypothetical protein